MTAAHLHAQPGDRKGLCGTPDPPFMAAGWLAAANQAREVQHRPPVDACPACADRLDGLERAGSPDVWYPPSEWVARLFNVVNGEQVEHHDPPPEPAALNLWDPW